ncbi:MAG: hypothetical protein ACFCVD_01150 [Nodosilinea sp.]
MNNFSVPDFTNPSFRHRRLYQFWWRSQGLWLSKLAKVTLRFLDERELQTFQKVHALEQPEFGIKMAWEYQTKSDVGQMVWCVDAAQPSLIFTDWSLTDNCAPTIYQYQIIDAHTLITTMSEIEERTVLEGDSRRLRELRTGDRLVRRLWENRFSP